MEKTEGSGGGSTEGSVDGLLEDLSRVEHELNRIEREVEDLIWAHRNLEDKAREIRKEHLKLLKAAEERAKRRKLRAKMWKL